VTDRVTESVRVLAGRYQLGERIGRGGMAEVFSGTDARLGRKVAVKLLRPSLANDPAFRTRFRQEAQAAAKMAHPTIVRVFDAGEETVRDPSGVEVQVPFIVMEHIQGRLLKDVIADGPVAPAEAVRIIDGVLTALEYSHRAGVVHRDIKPGNIMITSNGQVKVMDFGIARAISESSATIAQTSAILGTAQYFSPEQARGETVDARTDLYSAGVVLYEMLTGRPPFAADTAVAVAYQHLSEEPVPPSAVVSAISPSLNAVVLRALAKDRFERYQSATEFKAEALVAGTGKVPDRSASRSDDFNATLFGVNPGSTAASDQTLRRLAGVDDDRAPRQTQSRPPVAWIWAGVAVMAVIIVSVMVWVFSLQPSTGFINSASVKVDDVSGQTWTAAEKDLTKQGLAPQQIRSASSTVDEGTVIRTVPGPGETVGKDSTVSVYVSSGPSAITMPSLLNLTEAEAVAAIGDNGLKYKASEQANSATVPKGKVIASDPSPGTSNVQTGSSVTITVSTGLTSVPDVVGKTSDQATAAIQDPAVGLTVKLTKDAGCTGGNVSKQSVVGDAPQGTVVELTYCSGT